MSTGLVEKDRPGTGRTFFGHPLGLANLAGVEMWERFSFYGMQGILVYYLYYSVTQGGLALPESAATSIVGAYGGLVYLSAILGAWVADRLLGAERTLLVAAVVIMLGHISLAVVPGLAGVGIGLVCIALGSGSLKTTTSSVLGDLYAPEDTRRDAGFSIYYMGVNIGALVGPLLTGLLQGMKGFHWGFGLAAVGMALGLTQYLLLRRRTLGDAGHAVANPLDRRGRVRYGAAALVVVLLVVVLAVAGVITAGRLSAIVVGITVVATVALFAVILTSDKIDADERSRVVSFIPMFVASAVFWSLFQQQSTVVAVYADQRLDRDVFGWTMPPSFVQSINPVFIIVFAGVFAALWTRLGDRQPPTPVKFALGTLFMGVAFLLFLPFANGAPNSTPLLWLVLILFFFTLAELCLSPVGQSLSTKLAPAAFHTQMIALYFLSIAVGTATAGTLAGFYDPASERPYFLIIGAASIAVGVLLLLGRRWISARMAGVR
ncbi:peptide MFS transporter [Microlunatus flavus]|uniref:Proton-dependent oligopeptide transporter, POT family n=1 Tax=Microlunatus flavus TaxID=1036181 RepID=A0A1H9ICZ9_9ACTN|nr:peptide MFS transporter [Microlunatus flavus]SEQ72265.1 proton-dependent oligopeptide transporter, POT family [Microlunatus flavus]